MVALSQICRGMLGTAMIILASGCGGSSDVKSIANLEPCSGTITLDGKPMDHGIVMFAPANQGGGKPATGTIKSGQFKMETSASATGVVIGQYKVTVQSVEKEKSVSINPAEMANNKPKSLIPQKYGDIKDSGIEVEVKKGMAPVKLQLVSK